MIVRAMLAAALLAALAQPLAAQQFPSKPITFVVPYAAGGNVDVSARVLQAAIDCCFFPLYEIEHGHTALTYDPEATGRRRPVSEWLGLMGKTRHLLRPDNAETVAGIQAETDRRWARIKAMHEHPLL